MLLPRVRENHTVRQQEIHRENVDTPVIVAPVYNIYLIN